MYVASSNNGTGGWTDPKHIPSNNGGSFSPGAVDDKLSSPGGSPVHEDALRPGLTISDTTFAIVWQERPADGCDSEAGKNGSAEIYFAYTDTTWITDTLAYTLSDYSIGPDIAVAPGGVRHIAFMKASPCDSGGQSDYRIYYRGPFTSTINDQEEGGGIYLPLLLKNS